MFRKEENKNRKVIHSVRNIKIEMCFVRKLETELEVHGSITKSLCTDSWKAGTFHLVMVYGVLFFFPSKISLQVTVTF